MCQTFSPGLSSLAMDNIILISFIIVIAGSKVVLVIFHALDLKTDRVLAEVLKGIMRKSQRIGFKL